MPFCANCGTAVEGRYCPKCGAAVDSGAAPAAPPAAAPAGSAGMSENTAAGLCYVLGFITGIIFLVLEPYNKNKLIRFHAFQSIFLSVAAIIIRWGLLFILPWSFGLRFFLLTIVSLGFFVLWIFMLIQTFQGKKVSLPFIGDLAAKQA